MDFSTFDIRLHAESGNMEPLARHIEAGGHLCPGLRKILAAQLRGEMKYRRRSWAQQRLEDRIVLAVYGIRLMERERIGKCSEYRAAQIYLDRHPDMNPETLKTYLRNVRRRHRVKKAPQSSP